MTSDELRTVANEDGHDIHSALMRAADEIDLLSEKRNRVEELEERCGKASVIFRCDCGFEMEGPYDPSEWPCAKCKTGRLIPVVIRERDALADLVADLKRWKDELAEAVILLKRCKRIFSGAGLRTDYIDAYLKRREGNLRIDS